MNGAQLVGLVVGVLGLVATWTAWTGRWKSWAYSYNLFAVITWFPGMCIAAIGLAIPESVPYLASAVVTTLGALVTVVGYVLFLVRPAWLQPRWLKDRKKYHGIT